MTTAHGGQTLRSGVTGRLVRDALPPSVSLWNLGLYRLTDLAEPEQVYQLMHPALSADFPALRLLDIAPHNLPIQLTSFVDREHEIVEIVALLSIGRLITLTGTGGAGKTRLALQLAPRSWIALPMGRGGSSWHLLPTRRWSPTLWPPSLGVREEANRPLLNTLQEHLRSRRLLLLLDNCEHLVASCAELVDGLLRVCPDVRILATSREALGVSGETIWRVPSLPVFQEARDTRWIAFALQELGGLAQSEGNFERSFALTTEACGSSAT
jgi:hypothetical protein